MTPCCIPVYSQRAGAIRPCLQKAVQITSEGPLCSVHSSRLFTETRAALRKAGLSCLTLTPEDWAFLEYLMSRPGVLVTTADIGRHIAGATGPQWASLAAVRVFRLRAQFRLVWGDPAAVLIENRWGQGYVWRHDLVEALTRQREAA